MQWDNEQMSEKLIKKQYELSWNHWAGISYNYRTFLFIYFDQFKSSTYRIARVENSTNLFVTPFIHSAPYSYDVKGYFHVYAVQE